MTVQRRPHCVIPDLRTMAPPRFDPGVLKDLAVTIQHLVNDSRQIRPGDTFAAYPGEHKDGRDYIPKGIAAGANAVLWEKDAFQWRSEWPVANLGISGLRDRISQIADHVYGHPSRQLWVIGVTGTNGKTSCAHWLAQALTALGRKTAVIGTLGNGFPDALSATTHTTPDPVVLQEQLDTYVRQGARCVAMEVSSHGLAQGRVNGVRFAVALFTNLSRDHLDYHGDMQRYGASKAALFGWPELKHAVINLDDSFGRQLAQAVMKNSDTDVLGYGLQAGNPSDPVRCLRASAIRLNPGGMEFMVHSPWGQAPVKSQLLGRFNVHNLLGVLGALLLSGVKLDEAVRAVGQVQPVAGRMQRVTVQDGPAVVVDYAHTPDALEKVLMGLKETIAQDPTLSPKKPVLYCVFGCGGERDRGKRPLMGEIACHQADEVWITSDNPRGEDPQVIIEEILKGAKSKNAGCSIQIEPDRARAIHAAIAKAQPWDVVLIAGKGHESHQEVAGNKVPFDDVKVALVALKSWRPSGRGH